MANDIYIITPTDGNLSREFNVSPYSSNGNESPNSNVLDSTAVAADTSLLFHGKGSDSYGERIQENFYHLLENFSSHVEPNQPVHGQLWFDNSDNTLKIFQISGLDVYDMYGNEIILRLNGNVSSKYYQLTKDSIILRFASGFKFGIYNVTNLDFVNTYISSSVVDTSSTTYTVPDLSDTGKLISLTVNTTTGISIPTTPSLTPIVQQIGLWLPVFDTDTSILDDMLSNSIPLTPNLYGPITHLNVGGNRAINVADPIDNLDAVNKQYLTGSYLQTNGGTVSGNLIVNGTLTVQSSTVLNGDLTINNDNLLMNGGIISGVLDPTQPTHAMNLQYADANYVNLSGDIMTGVLTLSQHPVLDFHAATKKYVVDTVASVTSSGGATTLGALSDVVISSPIANQVLEFNGILWTNTNAPVAFVPADYISVIAGGTIANSGILKLDGQPGQNGVIGSTFSNDASTVGYVDAAINAEMLNQLPGGDVYVVGGNYDGVGDSLTLNRTGGQPDIIIPGIGAAITAVGSNSNGIPHTIIPEQIDKGDFLESWFSNDVNFPTFTLDTILESMSVSMKRMQSSNSSTPFISDGRSTPYDLNVINEINFINGYNNIQVYVNGLKQICSTRGYTDIFRNVLPDIYPSLNTGLSNSGTTYTFNVNVNGSGNQLITIIGNTAQNYSQLVISINNQLVGARAIIHEGVLSIISDSSGSTSSVIISNVSLITSLAGSVSIDTSVTGITYDYSEIGSYGDTNASQIQFVTIIPNSNTLEFVVLTSGGAPDNFGFEL